MNNHSDCHIKKKLEKSALFGQSYQLLYHFCTFKYHLYTCKFIIENYFDIYKEHLNWNLAILDVCQFIILHQNWYMYIASVDSPYPNVYLRAKVFFPLEHLWGSIRGTTTKCTQGLVCLEEIPEAKVGNFNVHVGIQKQVLSLKSKSR